MVPSSLSSKRLLPVPGFRRLPAVPVPADGESFASWVDRVGVLLGISPGQAARVLGLECRASAPSTRPTYFGVVLTPRSRRGLTEATGIPMRLLRAMQLARYDGTVLSLAGLDLNDETTLTPVAAREWMMVATSRACPHCLAESAVWPLWWRLGVAAVCPVHRCLLIDECPACGVRLRRGSGGLRPRGLPTRPPFPEPGTCGTRLPGREGLCPQVLAEIPAVAVPQSLAELQRKVLAVAEGGTAWVAGERAAGSDWFTALRFLTALARIAVEDNDLRDIPCLLSEAFEDDVRRRRAHRQGGGATRLGAMPANAAVAAAFLSLSAPILDAPTTEDARSRLTPWAERLATVRRKSGGTDPLRSTPRPAFLGQLLTSVSPRPSRVAGAIPRGVRHRLGAQHIPHLADVDDYRSVIAIHLPGTADVSGRRLTSLALARLGGTASWAEAAAALGMDPVKAGRAANTLVQRITDPDAFWAAVTCVADRMHERGLVNYADRREAFAVLREVPHHVLFPVFRPLGWDVTWQRLRHAAAWVWQHFTGGDVHDAPAYEHPWDGTSRESVREGWRRFRDRLPVEAADALAAWGAARLAEKGTE
ncbi:TniQ family protein [Streptomyces sp. UNOB3_S3]|uniref:TniQ family protein n=1 Tax=Streptomyces sp. UNOB3_S3 TaxID=2871682 RepID=UPI001E3FFC9E|nr:TniQ family protein [Streptomyces sp. UNOB3_S3]MCC3773618.1 TniQ family protein [Streptomyces sp. UNOB3_S3]